jgi:hypothetical protein
MPTPRITTLRALAPLSLLGLGACETPDLIDEMISDNIRTYFVGANALEAQVKEGVSQQYVFRRADEDCGVHASPTGLQTRPNYPGYVFYTFRCERPAPFPPPRDNRPLPDVLKSPLDL